MTPDFAGQPNTNKSITDPNLFDYRIVKLQFLKSCDVTAEPTDASRGRIAPPSYVDIREQTDRERKAVLQEEQ